MQSGEDGPQPFAEARGRRRRQCPFPLVGFRFQASCYQGKNAFTLVPLEEISEDCLYLNVYTPQVNENTSYPVRALPQSGPRQRR